MPSKSKKVVLKPSKGEKLGIKLLQAVKEMKAGKKMPSKSKKQHNLMAAVANNPKFAKKVGIPQSVGEDYVEADKGRKFRSGGMAGCGTKRMKWAE
jgi:hypothetical protein